MMGMARIILLMVIGMFISGQNLIAQALYPVTAILDVQGPYSPVFSTFSDPSNQAFRPNKMALRLRLNDLNEASLAVRLKWEISGPGIEFQTNDDFLGGIANLISGQYITLDNAALTPYFDLFGSSGISDEFVTGTGGYLPEGSYSFCVTAFELTKGQQVSNTSCREIYIEEYEPPFLNNPSGTITPTFPQNLQISWTPRHFGVFPVIYNVKIWETFEGLTPDQVVSSQMPYITLDVNQVTQTFLNSQNGLLTPGRSYLAQVQIRDGVNGPFGMPSVIFKNNGNSEVLAFTYGEDDPEGVCTAPLDFRSELDDQQNIVLFWQEQDPTLAPTVGRSAQVAYQVKYREVGATEWQIKETSVRTLLMTGLRQGETYEIELYKVCINGLTSGGALKVLVPKRNKARILPDCGEEMDISGMSEVPLERLAINDTIFASGTEVIVQEVAGSGGVFTGKGFIRLPLLSTIKIAVEFDAISVNEDFELTAGEIRTVYNPGAGNVVDLKFNSDQLSDYPTFTYQDSFKIISLTADGTLIYLDGREVLVNGAYIKGKGLNQFVFSGERFEVFEEYEKFDSLGPVRVKFAPSGNQRYGFDAYKPAIDKEYEKYFDLPVSYKSVAEGAFDEVEVFVEGGLEEGDTIVFVDELTKAELQFSPKGVSTKYRVNAMGPGRPSAIIAYVINKGVAGKLNIYSTPITKVPIKIVNVNGVSGNSAGVESTINKIFAPGLFKVEVVGQDDFDYVEKEDGIINVENHFLNAYSPDMKKLADEYFKTRGQLDETFYLFISDKLEASTQGLMPQGYAAGFISSTASAQVYAHELAHGVFNFDHSWLMYDLDSMKTQNLMDYSGGTELWYRQWKQMVKPGFPKGWRKDEKDGSQLSAGNLDYQCISNEFADIIANEIFVNFNGKPINVSSFGKPLAFYGRSEDAQYQGKLAAIVTFNGTNLGNSLYKDDKDSTIFVFKDEFVEWIGANKNFVTIPPLSEDFGGNLLVFIENDTSNVYFKGKLFEKALKTCEWNQIDNDLTEDEKCLEKYKNHPYLREQSPLGTFVNQYPCVLGKLEHFDFKDQTRSQFADDLVLIVSEMIGIPLIASFVASVLPEIFTQALMEMIAAKKIKDAGIAFNLDALIQNTVIYYFPPEEDALTWSEASSHVDLGQSAIAGLETFVELDCKSCEIAIKSAIQCLYAGATKAENGEIFNNQACGIALLETVGLELILQKGGPAFKYLASKVPKKVLLKHLLRNANLAEVHIAGFPGLSLPKTKIYSFFKSIHGPISTSNVKILLDITDDVAADKIAKIIQRNGALETEIFDSGWFTDLSKAGLSGDEIAKLLEDFEGKIDLVGIFKNDLGLLKPWQKISKHKLIRKDVDFLNAYKKALNDPEMVGAPINIESRIETWIEKSHLKCKTCAGGSEPFLDEVLENLYFFKKFVKIKNAIKVVDQIGSSTKDAVGANWVMNFIKMKNISPLAFEEIVTDGRNFTADIVSKLDNKLKYYECKSWEKSIRGLFITGKTNLTKQLTNYFHNNEISNLTEFAFYFNPSEWIPTAEDLNAALKATDYLFKKDPISWSKYRVLFGSEVDDIITGDVDSLIDIITKNHYNKIINPS